MSTSGTGIPEVMLTHRSRCGCIEEHLQLALEVLDDFATRADSMPEAAVEHLMSAVIILIRRIQSLRQFQRDNDAFEHARTRQQVKQLVELWKLHDRFLATNANRIYLHAENLEQALVSQDMGRREMTVAAATAPRDSVPLCSFCFEPEDAKATIIQLPCGHWFHCACAVRWVHTQHTCPVCRAHVSSLEDCEFHETGSAE
jgi:Ring finger domain